jgi:hypothetical protein
MEKYFLLGGAVAVVSLLLAGGVVAFAGSNMGPGPAEVSTNVEDRCSDEGGNYLPEHDECVGITETSCDSLDGSFDSCASACRNNPDARMCTKQCVQVCDNVS